MKIDAILFIGILSMCALAVISANASVADSKSLIASYETVK